MRYHGLVLGVCAGANALAISEPTKRQDAGYMHQPDPTPHVGMSGMRHLAMDKRQASSASELTTYTIVVAPDSTCGFLSASPGNAITCSNKQRCSWELSYNTAIFCGSKAYNRCWDREDATNTEICDDVCQSNEYNLLCTETASPYCGTYAYPGGIRDFRCATSKMTRVQSVDTTYKGQNNRVFGTTVVNDETTIILDDLTKTTESSTTESGSGSSTTTESSEPTESSDESNPGGGKSTPIGAIVGGSIGGFVALSLVVLAALWFWKKNRKTDATAAPPMQQQQQPYQQPLAAAMPPPNATEAPTDSVPPMYQNYPKSEVTSPTQSEWRESMITAQSATTPVSNQGWGGQYPQGTGGQNEVHEMPHDNYGRQA
ncbi:hypothetical protein F53441_14180 [Fusarium austroafricanum]|uniref:WSC domain-containing protein n=1 Tax=Fusarium austroafricanum TaxID=2364996 RepID=A0A8H4NC13_9HYPO|nr:hypothetical protein F53441_14180 [Fusarium austroafricanum]